MAKKPATTPKQLVKRQTKSLKKITKLDVAKRQKRKLKKPKVKSPYSSPLMGLNPAPGYLAKVKKIMGHAGYKWSKGKWVRK